MQELTIADLRDIISEVIEPSIELYRSFKKQVYGEKYHPPSGPPTDHEIDEHATGNRHLDFEVIKEITDPGLIGYVGKSVRVSTEWINEFTQCIINWSKTFEWLRGDDSAFNFPPHRNPTHSDKWNSTIEKAPLWLGSSPSCLILANELLKNGRLLSEMNWRQFEELIGALLEKEGWKVTVTRGSKDGGVDVIALKNDVVLGNIKSVWQAKKYGPTNYVKLNNVRELSAIREENKASKAFVVTTSRLTRDAVAWIHRDTYRLGYKDGTQLEKWINGIIYY